MRMRMRTRTHRGRAARLTAFAGALVALLLFTAHAEAQLHWDASAQAGVTKRVLGDRPSGGKDAGFGPALQLTGHIALLPLVRLGAYVGHDISPLGGDASARDLTWAGARVKVMSPWPRGAMRLWLFFGFGYDGVYQRSTSAPRNFPGPPGMPTVRDDAVVHGAGGGSVHPTSFASRGSSAPSSAHVAASASAAARTRLPALASRAPAERTKTRFRPARIASPSA